MASHDMVLEIGVALGTLVLAFALVALEEITNSGMIIILFYKSKEEVLNIFTGEFHGCFQVKEWTQTHRYNATKLTCCHGHSATAIIGSQQLKIAGKDAPLSSYLLLFGVLYFLF